MYSVSEVAKKFGVSSTAVYKKIGKPEFKDLVTTEGGRTLISDELLGMLENTFRPKVSEPKSTVDESLNKVIETLSNQLEVKDQQILALQNHVAELTRLHENQQKLLGNAQQQMEVQLLEEPKKSWLKKIFG